MKKYWKPELELIDLGELDLLTWSIDAPVISSEEDEIDPVRIFF